MRGTDFNPQIVVTVDSKGVKCLKYTEDPKTKTNQGGLTAKKHETKVVNVYQASDPNCCPVHLYQKYISLLPKICKCEELYLHPANKTMPWCWYSDRAVGINTLRSSVKRLAAAVGLEGKFSNHSLWATPTTRLYAGGIPEKLIKEITGHKSVIVLISVQRTN